MQREGLTTVLRPLYVWVKERTLLTDSCLTSYTAGLSNERDASVTSASMVILPSTVPFPGRYKF